MTKGDCLDELPKIKEKIDLVLVDLPFGQTACKWDSIIDLSKMWIELKKICKRDCIFVFFCTTKFGYKLIQSNEKWFRYDLVWEKSRKVGFLSANKMPLRKHEMVYVFKEKQGSYNPQKTEGKPYTHINKNIEGVYGKINQKNYENTGYRYPTSILQFSEDFEYQNNTSHEMVYVFADSNNEENKQLDFNQNIRDYSNYIKQHINKSTKDIVKDVNNTGISHFFTKGRQFRMISEKDYNILIEKYNLKDMEGFRDYQSLKDEWGELTYNPQMTEGKPYISNGIDLTNSYYRGGEKIYKGKPINNKGNRHPTTILKFNNPAKSLHRTAKPVDLCEWLIKTYSNEGENVLDFTMGSGTTGIACLNTNRNFIGIEKDETIFKLARHRIFKEELILKLNKHNQTS